MRNDDAWLLMELDRDESRSRMTDEVNTTRRNDFGAGSTATHSAFSSQLIRALVAGMPRAMKGIMKTTPEVSITLAATDVAGLATDVAKFYLPSRALIAEANAYAEARIDATLLKDKLNALPGFEGRDAAVSNVDAVVRQLLRIEGELAREIEAQVADEDEAVGAYLAMGGGR